MDLLFIIVMSHDLTSYSSSIFGCLDIFFLCLTSFFFALVSIFILLVSALALVLRISGGFNLDLPYKVLLT